MSRAGQDDARLLAVERIHDLRQLPYEALAVRAYDPDEIEHVHGLDEQRYRRKTAVRVHTRGTEGDLRITVQVTRPGLLGRFAPLAEETVIATLDGRLITTEPAAPPATRRR